MSREYLFTSESVSAGHPDKICDQISDSILDEYLVLDPQVRVACEVFATTNTVIVGGEVRTTNNKKLSNIDEIVRNVVKEIGYEQEGFNYKTLRIENLIHAQSSDIATGVDAESGAGDQGIMFGYAINEAEEFMPASIYYSHRLLQNILADKNHNFGPDAKSQITLKFVDGKPVGAEKVLVSIQHRENVSLEQVKEYIIPFIKKTLPDGWYPKDDKNIYINPTGRFVIGGPDGDTGLTGRKIIVDTYGGNAPHGGGAFSGKDATKVDRSAAYIARYLAKNVVANELAEKVLIQIAYAIGVAKPLAFYIDTFGTGKIDDDILATKLQELVDLRPSAIIERLDLRKPIFKKTATYGHFGRKPEDDGSFSWEKIDLTI